MRLARVKTPAGPRAAVLRDGFWREIADLFTVQLQETGVSWPVDGTSLAAPCEPRVVVGMSHNGSPADRGRPPQAFLKSARTVCGPGAPIHVETGIGSVAIEGELALVIGARARHLDIDSALEVVRGFTIANDVTAVDQVPLDTLFTQAKNGDGFTPIGPWIETDLDVSDLTISVEVDGVVRASGSTSSLAWTFAEQLVYLTSVLELGPGDIVMTGAPATTVPVVPGQRSRIRIDGLGSLENLVVVGPPRSTLPDLETPDIQED